MNNFFKNIVVWIGILLVIAFLMNVFQQSGAGTNANMKLAYSEFMNYARGGNISDVTISGQTINGTLSSGEAFKTVIPNGENVVERLDGTGVRIEAEQDDSGQISALGMLLSWFLI